MLVIRILTELFEYGHKLDEKMKVMLREIKENVQGTNSDGKGRQQGLKSMVWSRRKKETFNQNQIKKQEFKNMKRG